jgi:hypothetical protein
MALALTVQRATGGATATQAVAAPRPGEAERTGRVMLLSCPGYLPRDPATCTWAADPRGHGLAIGAD